MKNWLKLMLAAAVVAAPLQAMANKRVKKTAQTAVVSPTQTLYCKLGISYKDANNPPQYGQAQFDTYLCHIGGKYYTAHSDSEINALLKNLGYGVTKVERAVFANNEKVILIHTNKF